MKKCTFTRFLCVGVILTCVQALQAGEAKTGFLDKIHKGKDGDAKYIVFVPSEYNGEKAYPVILFLHGSGETGTDGQKQAKAGLAKAIRDKQGKVPFIVVFPQSQQRTWRAGSDDANRALAILEEVQKDYKTDRKRVYLTGLSMGGSGTWSLAAAYPERWAAIAPICGGGDPKNVEKIKSLPCWCFVGDKDSAKLVENNRNLMKSLKDAGAAVRYDEYPGVGHNSWDRAYATADLYTWFLKHSTK